MQDASRAVQQMSTQAAQAIGRLDAAVSQAASSLTTLGAIAARGGLRQVGSEAQQATRGVEEFSRSTARARQAAQAASQQFTVLGVSLRTVLQQATQFAAGLGLVTTIQGAITTLKNLATESVTVATRMQSLTAAFNLTSGGAAKAQQTFAFLRAEATRIGVDFTTTAESFKRFEAAARGTALEGAQARNVFVAVTEASRVLGLSSENTTRALVALEQIISKGRVSSEELRQQLGEHLPGAFQIAARAMGVTTAELDKMLETGQLLATDFLPKFGAQIRKEFGPGLAEAAQTAAATFARLGNEIQTLSVKTGQSILRLLEPVASALESYLRQAREVQQQVAQAGARAAAGVFAGRPVSAAPETVAGVLPTGATEEEIRRFQGVANALADAQRRITEESTRSSFQQWATGNLALAQSQAQELEKQLRTMREQVQQRIALARATEADLDSLGEYATRQERISAANRAHRKATEELLVLQKQLPRELEQAAIKAELLPGSLSKAEAQLAELRKQAEEFQKRLEARPTLRLTEESQETIRVFQARHAALTQEIKLEEERERAGKKATREAEQAAKERQQLAEQLQKTLIDLSNDQFEAERQHLAREVTELRAAKVAETQITAFESAKRQDILRREVEDALKTLDEQQRGREAVEKAQTEITQKAADDRRKIEETITAVQARESTSRVDDFRAQLARQRKDLEDHFATGEDLRRFDAAATAAVQRLQTEETAKALRDQQREYERFAHSVARTLEEGIFDVISGRIDSTKDLLDSLRDYFLRTIARMAAAALTNVILVRIVPTVAQALGVPGAAPGFAAAGGTAGGGGDIFSSLLGFGQQANSISGALGGPTVQGALGQATGVSGKGGLLSNLSNTVIFGGTTGGIAGAGAGTAGGALTPAAAGSVFGSAAAAEFAAGIAAGAGAGAGGGALAAGAGSGLFGAAAASEFAAGGTALTAAGGSSLTGAAAAGGVTLGAAATGIGAGIAAGLTLKQINDLIGLTDLIGSRGSSALAGAGGGAIAGTIILPGIGTAIGAALGALLGGLLGGGSKRREPEFRLTGADAPTFGFQAGEGVTVARNVLLESRGINLGTAHQDIRETIRTQTDTLFESVLGTLRQLPERIQEKALPQLNALADSFESTFANVRFKGKDIEKQLTNFIEKVLPESFNGIFTPFIQSLQRVAPVFNALNEAIEALEARRDTLLQGIEAARASVTEALFTPAQLFEERRADLQELLGEFRTASPETQAALVPLVTTAAQEVFRLSQDENVFGDDREAVRQVQQETFAIFDELEATTKQVFGDAVAATERQIDLLLESVATQNNIEGLMQQAVEHLRQLVQGTPDVSVPSFQTGPGQVKTVGRTGLALVHEGEIVSRQMPVQVREGDINVTVHAPPGADAQGIARLTASALAEQRRQERGRQQLSRYRQNRFL